MRAASTEAPVRRAVVALSACLAFLVALAAAPAARASCQPWSATTLLQGQNLLENLVFDRRGGLLISASGDNAILRLTPDGSLSTLIDDVNAPGGLRIRHGTLYFNTGDDAASGVNNTADGTLEQYDLESGQRRVWARKLVMPNGLVLLPSGDAIVSRDLGQGTGITRIPADDPHHPQYEWAELDDTNGMVLDPTHRWLYTVETFTSEARVYRIRVAKPSRIDVVAQLGDGSPFLALDDMTRDSAGRLYIAANFAGEIIRLNPDTGASCVIASGLQNPSAVKFGRGPGWHSDRLYVTGFDGTVRELRPPAP
jgi:sugar lactone lactonase YvrE